MTIALVCFTAHCKLTQNQPTALRTLFNKGRVLASVDDMPLYGIVQTEDGVPEDEGQQLGPDDVTVEEAEVVDVDPEANNEIISVEENHEGEPSEQDLVAEDPQAEGENVIVPDTE